MILNEHEYLCTVPAIPKSAKNETADAMARAEEEKELARATTRGWELLQEMQGKCMYFVSGWWSYKFCYNDGVKQFHQLPPQKGAPLYPPEEDKSTPSYILGRVNRDGVNDRRYRGEISDGKSGVESTELQVKGQMRYLVQKLGAGTICDLTGKERRIEVQVCTKYLYSSNVLIISCILLIQDTYITKSSSTAILNQPTESDGSMKFKLVRT